MKTSPAQKPAGLLRNYVEPIPVLNLIVGSAWTWNPSKIIDEKKLIQNSPTSEYGSEGDEDDDDD